MTTNDIVKVGMLVSYDYAYVKDSLPLIYPYVDYIAFAIDKDRRTWSGEKFQIPDSFFDWVRDFDVDKKIHIYEDSFYVPSLKAIECDTRERNMLAQYMGQGGWHLQIDSDEYFLDFDRFSAYLRNLDSSKNVLVYARWITIYKQNENDYFLIRTKENFPVATNNPIYSTVRISECEVNHYTDFEVLHQSWARSDEEIQLKLRNWGHNIDFDTQAYYQFWKATNRQTYRYMKSFHPLDPWLWPSLDYFEAYGIVDLAQKVAIFLKEQKDEIQKQEKIKAMDFIPPVLYKINSLLKKQNQ